MQNTQAIDTFLQDWRKSSFNYYTDLFNAQRKLFDIKWKLMEKFNYNCVSPNTVFDPSYVDAINALK